LADILERVLNTGVVIAGDVKIKLCDVELLSIQLRLVICSVEKARELGISWWWQTSEQPALAPAQPAFQPAKAILKQEPDRFNPEELRQFRDFQRFQQVMQAIEQGPR
jgi:hypothetical protein